MNFTIFIILLFIFVVVLIAFKEKVFCELMISKSCKRWREVIRCFDDAFFSELKKTEGRYSFRLTTETKRIYNIYYWPTENYVVVYETVEQYTLPENKKYKTQLIELIEKKISEQIKVD